MKGTFPKSGIGVDGTHLVIAPPGNPVIRLDIRLVDNISLIQRSPNGAYLMAALAGAGSVAAGIFMPGILFVGLLGLTAERWSAGAKKRSSQDLLISLGSLEVSLHVEDGTQAAKQIADALSQYCRNAPITRADVYQDAKQRLSDLVAKQPNIRESAETLQVGNDEVSVADGFLRVGQISFRIEEVREYALRGANLHLPGGRLLQAAMGLLVVAAAERAQQGENLQALSKRIAAYEEWTGRHAGR